MSASVDSIVSSRGLDRCQRGWDSASRSSNSMEEAPFTEAYARIEDNAAEGGSKSGRIIRAAAY